MSEDFKQPNLSPTPAHPQIEIVTGVTGFDHSELLKKVAAMVAQEEGVGGELYVNLIGAAEITALNAQHFGKTGSTDVIAIPIGGYIAGDIFICDEVAKRQAQEHNWGYDHELVLLCVHGVLHLCGYDHHTPEAKLQMAEIQKRYLEKLGFTDGYWYE